MSQVKISVIVPVYNVEKFLPECLDSLKNQSMQELEFICINDGSTDNSLEILNRYAEFDKRFIIISQKNGGLSAARNTGLKYAKGDYIYFIDSDDLIAPEHLENMYNAAIKQNADLVVNENFVPFCDEIPLNPRVTEVFADGIYDVTPEYILQRHKNVTVWTKLYKKSLILDNNISFPVGLIYEDQYFYFVTMPYAKKVVQCNTGMYYYRQSAGSIVAKAKSQKRCYDIFKIFELIYNFYKERDLLGKYFLPYDLLTYRSSQVADYKEFRAKTIELLDKLGLNQNDAKKAKKCKWLLNSPELFIYRINKLLG